MRLANSTVLVVVFLSILLACFSNAQARSHQSNITSSKVFVSVGDLPPEARETYGLIKQGGPFPYHRDGLVFGNREYQLPKRPHGYYHEYTVKTPRAPNRGARRIVCGVVTECYYTDDHYQSFKRIKE
jgi:ribonuclease T1